ncbi:MULTISPECIES: P-loop NTPase fold protein [unclassified Phyllobacterium]|uniref:P-loop NTPase fold protein n=1 Tax=unclassified Phyllobacterium TaxID=2638441 RepID=UPI0030131CB6
MTVNPIERKILIDQPSAEDLFRGKGHDRTADALAKAIANFREEDRAIGLDGPWGSGKSSVVEIAERKLRSAVISGKVKFHFFTFDIWKSQGSSFRRSFLEHFLDWTKLTFTERARELEEIEKKVKGKVREIHSNNQSILDWYGIAVLLFLPFLPIYYFWAKAGFDTAREAKDEIGFLLSWPALTLYIVLGLTFLKAFGKYWIHKGKNTKTWRQTFAKLRIAISQTLLISARQYENQEVTQYIRETDPNDFEFQSTLREILTVVQGKNIRVVMVLDNIDRLPKKEIADYWALVRAVFSRGPLSKTTGNKNPVTAIVPYDRHLIEGKDDAPSTDSVENFGSISSLGSREIFSKTFDEILTVSPPVMSNSRDFFLQKIGEALSGFSDTDELFRVYLIFNRILRVENGKATPRQIISFINELTGLYVLHEFQIALPTIAIYIAYQDALEAYPGRLSEKTLIDDRLRAIASDDNLERNLAAIIFNVEPGLAFQLLLDDKIKQSAVATGPDELIALANSPGFDLRVNEVIQDNMQEWQSSGDYSIVIVNFAALSKNYSGNARRHFCKSLVEAFQQVHSIELTPNIYTPYLKLYGLCEPIELLGLTQNLLSCVLSSIEGADSNDAGQGRNWINFVDQVYHSLDAVGQRDLLKDALETISLPTSPDFLFGVASSTPSSNVAFSHFKKPTLDLSKDNDFLQTIAKEESELALHAFSEFKAVSLLNDDQWIAIGNSILQELISSDVDDAETYINKILLLSAVWVYTDTAKRSEIALLSAFQRSEFYENLHDSVYDDTTSPALAHALFLAGQVQLQSGLPTPMNGQNVQLESSQFIWFKDLYDGKLVLAQEQYEIISGQAKKALQVDHWLEQGRLKPDQQFFAGVVRSAFLTEELPRISVALLIENFDYLKSTTGREFLPMLARFDSRIKQKDFAPLELAAYPIGLLSDTSGIGTGGWSIVHNRVGELLDVITPEEWLKHLNDADHTASILLEKIATSGYVSKKLEFRDIFIRFITETLSGKAEILPSVLNYDPALDAIEASYHADIFRKIREDLHDVTAATLEKAAQMFPRLINNLIAVGDRITRIEKDNIVRQLLCSALEGDNRAVMNMFLGVGRIKVADFVKQSEESTQAKVDGSWKHFSEHCQDRDWSKQVGELLHGKRKAKTIFDFLWPTQASEDEEA